jgi:hypothetical protein
LVGADAKVILNPSRTQIQPNPAKPGQRKSKENPWISLSEVSLFNGLCRPPCPKKSIAPFSRVQSTELQCRMSRRAVALRRSYYARLSDLAQVIHRNSQCNSQYDKDSEFWQGIAKEAVWY